MVDAGGGRDVEAAMRAAKLLLGIGSQDPAVAPHLDPGGQPEHR